jgi:hypothetical protein
MRSLVICTPYPCAGGKIEKNEMGGASGLQLHTVNMKMNTTIIYFILRQMRTLQHDKSPNKVAFAITISMVQGQTNNPVVCLFSWRYNPLWLYFHSPVAGFSLLVFEVS